MKKKPKRPWEDNPFFCPKCKRTTKNPNPCIACGCNVRENK